MIVLRPELDADARDAELAKVEAWLAAEGAGTVGVDVRGTQRMAYPMDGTWEGFMVFLQFTLPPASAPRIQKLLSTPDADSQGRVLRWNLRRLA